MSSLALPSENLVEPSPADSCHDSTISRPRYVVLQSLVGVMLAYQLLSGAELIASRPTSGLGLGHGCPYLPTLSDVPCEPGPSLESSV